MIEIKDTPVKFYSEDHHYEIDGVRVKYSLTEILRKFNISPDYTFVDKGVLQQAALRGTQLHQLLEIYDNTKAFPTFADDEYKPLIEDYIKKGQNVIKSEVKVSYNTLLATSIDKIIEENGDIIVADIKTTSSPHIDSVIYQCSFGAYMLEQTTGIKANKGRLIWLNKGKNKVEIKDFELIPKESIERLLECVKNDDFRDYGEILQTESLAIAHDQLAKFENYLQSIERMQNELKEFKEYLLTQMRLKGIKSLNLDNLQITYVLPTTKRTFDVKALQAAHPELDLQDFYKETEVKDSIRLKLSY